MVKRRRWTSTWAHRPASNAAARHKLSEGKERAAASLLSSFVGHDFCPAPHAAANMRSESFSGLAASGVHPFVLLTARPTPPVSFRGDHENKCPHRTSKRLSASPSGAASSSHRRRFTVAWAVRGTTARSASNSATTSSARGGAGWCTSATIWKDLIHRSF